MPQCLYAIGAARRWLMRQADAAEEGRDDHVRSFERGIAIICALGEHHSDLTTADLADLTGVPRAAARRFLSTLVALGYARASGRTYSLRPTVLELGNAYLTSSRIGELALPAIRKLAARLGDASALSVLADDEIVYLALARGATRPVVGLNVTIGSRLPAYPTAMGRVLLAGQSAEWRDGYLARTTLRPMTVNTIQSPPRLRSELGRIARNGYAAVDRELDMNIVSVAVPVRDSKGTVVAAVNISTHPARRSLWPDLPQLVATLRDTAAQIQEEIGTRD
jgi:IclR family pca regulon transcriptional regulator